MSEHPLNGAVLGGAEVLTEGSAVASPVSINLASMAQLTQHWEWIRKGLLEVKRRTEEENPEFPVSWGPQHVSREVEAGWNARQQGQQPIVELWIAYNALGVPIAFTVTQMTSDVFTYVPLGLFVWIAYRDRLDATPNVVATMDEHLASIARERRLEWLECATRRNGLLRRMRRHGWSEHLVYLRKRVYPKEG